MIVLEKPRQAAGTDANILISVSPGPVALSWRRLFMRLEQTGLKVLCDH